MKYFISGFSSVALVPHAVVFFLPCCLRRRRSKEFPFVAETFFWVRPNIMVSSATSGKEFLRFFVILLSSDSVFIAASLPMCLLSVYPNSGFGFAFFGDSEMVLFVLRESNYGLFSALFRLIAVIFFIFFP